MVFRSFLSGTSKSSTSYNTIISNDNGGLSNDVANSGFSPVKIAIEIESPPCVLYGNALDSRGAVINGLLRLKIKDPYSNVPFIDDTLSLSNLNGLTLSNPDVDIPELTKRKIDIFAGYTKITVTSVRMKLIQVVKYNKPFVPDCNLIQGCDNCISKINIMKKWDIQVRDTDFSVGTYSFPFSYLIPGSVPATCSLGATAQTEIKYKLVADVSYKIPFKNSASFGREERMNLEMPVAVTRSIARGPDKNSLRVFPPTKLIAAAVLPNVIHPKSTFPLELKIDGISVGFSRWRMRKLNWKIEETTRVRGYSCKPHKNNLKSVEKDVKQKEEEKKKKKHAPIKRYGDIGPQITVSLGTPDNIPFNSPGRRNQERAGQHSNNTPVADRASASRNVQSTSQGLSAVNTADGNQDDDDDDDDDQPNEFIHPNDDAMRQEVEQQHELQRQKQIQHELESDTSLFTQEVRILCSGEMKTGWKTDFSSNGHIDLVTDINCMALNSGVSNHVRYTSTARPKEQLNLQNPVTVACDVQDPVLGIYVSHLLSVELVVAEEALQYANGQPLSHSKQLQKSSNDSSASLDSEDQRLAELSPMFANRNVRSRQVESEDITPTVSDNSIHSLAGNKGTGTNMKVLSVPTGAARVLRMQFRVVFTERSGLGISWDEEVPPLYQEIKLLTPPEYGESFVPQISDINRTIPSDNELSEETPNYFLNTPVPISHKLLPPPQAKHHNSVHRVPSSQHESFF